MCCALNKRRICKIKTAERVVANTVHSALQNDCVRAVVCIETCCGVYESSCIEVVLHTTTERNTNSALFRCALCGKKLAACIRVEAGLAQVERERGYIIAIEESGLNAIAVVNVYVDVQYFVNGCT